MSYAEDLEKNRRHSSTLLRQQLAPTEYVKRHDGLAKIIHQKLAEAAELIEDKSPYYHYTPANVLENENFKLYWNRSILTDKTVPFIRPDINFMNKKIKNTFLIDTAVPNTHNLAKTITDKQNKYQELAKEICAMWKQKAAQVIPIVIIYLFTAIGLSPGGSGYFTYKQNMKLVTNKFKSGELYEKHVVATWNVGNHLSICL